MRSFFLLLTLLGAGVGALMYLKGCDAPVDFAGIRFSFHPTMTGGEGKKQVVKKPLTASEARALEAKEMAERGLVQSTARAQEYLTTATNDYFQGQLQDALLRLERAKWHNPYNYGVFRLSGQIFLELNQYRKAFNDWSRAAQLPNDDQYLKDDYNVLKRVLTYNRQEMDRLQRRVNRNPDDLVAKEHLKELELQMQE
ncbi:MAG TPA: hypothetical protein PKO06_11375 [Candidatus Ozemobacteraceae bacterium]|nr:hypothetical protein [Candidatus Ozemobacteraceae bacterium]